MLIILMEGGENAQKDYSDEPKKFYGVTVGRVINPLDPMMLGRLQVQMPFIDPYVGGVGTHG